MNKIEALKEKMGNTVWDLGVAYVRPFGFLVGKPAFEGAIEKAVGKAKDAIKGGIGKIKGMFGSKKKPGPTNVQSKIDNAIVSAEQKTPANELQNDMKKQSIDLAQQQVQQAAQPLQNIEGMQNGAQAELQKNGQEVSVAIAKKEDAQQKRDQEQALQMRELLNEMRVGNSAILKNLNDPYVVPLPIPMQQQQNPAMMRND